LFLFESNTIQAPIVPTLSGVSTSTTGSNSTSSQAQQLPGLQTSLPPWPPEITNLKERLNAIGLPALSQEGTVLHTHQHLDIYIHGVHFNIPAGIGINEVAGFISPIHVHDDPNIIHVESPTIQTFTLGQFFDIWGLRFNDKCIGAYCTDSSSNAKVNIGVNTGANAASAATANTDAGANPASKLQVFVNGKEVLNNFKNIELTAHEEIVITFGTSKEIPSPMPSSFNFPAGL